MTKEDQPRSFKVPSGAIFALEVVKDMMRRNRLPSLPQTASDDADSATQRPPERFLNPMDQYSDGVGTEIELFFADKKDCEI